MLSNRFGSLLAAETDVPASGSTSLY